MIRCINCRDTGLMAWATARGCDCRSRRFRRAVRPATSKVQPNGDVLTVCAYGLRIGYWPCLKAPFIEIALHHRRYQLWHGLPSYKAEGE